MNLHITAKLPVKPGLRKRDAKAILATRLLLDTLKDHPKVKIVEVADVSKRQVNCTSEKGKLSSAIVSLPTYLDWAEPINVAELANMGNKPNRATAVIEHIQFLLTLLSHGVELTLVKPSADTLEGVYTRDIAAVIGHKCILANMVAEPRWPEEKTITGGIIPPSEVKLEGGNVIIDGDVVFIGVGDRTNIEAVVWLQEVVGTAF
ncbi:hypothetical protein J4450_04955, partial [Candidatus Micrarchaeota archaeon]|nr:hypothetical protein [Candidatus Micrarchaeota archaeon]